MIERERASPKVRGKRRASGRIPQLEPAARGSQVATWHSSGGRRGHSTGSPARSDVVARVCLRQARNAGLQFARARLIGGPRGASVWLAANWFSAVVAQPSPYACILAPKPTEGKQLLASLGRHQFELGPAARFRFTRAERHTHTMAE